MNNEEITYCKSTGKRCYTKKEAESALSFFRSKHRNRKARGTGRKNIPCRCYLCDKCGSYHLTHIKMWDTEKHYRQDRSW